MCLILVATAIEAASLLNQLTPLVLLGGGRSTGALASSQLQALATVSADVSTAGYDVYTVFYGLDLLILSYLILKSAFLPRAVGILVAVDGLAYLIYAFTGLLSPGAAHHLVPWIQIPAPVGEGSLSLWLIVAGINVARWQQHTTHPAT